MPYTPTRMCVICRKRFTKAELGRHVLSPGGELVPDIRQTLPGRGWYLCAQAACRERFDRYAAGRNIRKKLRGRVTGYTDADRAQGGKHHE